MCGIAGYFLGNGKKIKANTLGRLDQALAHRGPDGSGKFENQHCGFTHRRLSIVDIHNGNQPFIYKTANHRRVLIANGEIYNHQVLRELYAKGFPFRSASDCETLLALWVKIGDNYIEKLRGMYAIAMYDEATNIGLLARDPFGIKPLYVAQTNDGVFFASEQQALRQLGIASNPPNDVFGATIIDQQFSTNHISAFPPIRRVKPGEVIIVKAGRIEKSVTSTSINSPPTNYSDPSEFEHTIQNTVSAHLMADVPIGMFFSGGVDSSAILAAFNELKKSKKIENHFPLINYTTRFPDRADHEFEFARAIANHSKLDFVDVPYLFTDFWSGAGAAVKACDDAIADYAILPTMKLAMRANQDVKVILSGEGGDETFAGYRRYQASSRRLIPKPFIRPGPGIKNDIFSENAKKVLSHEYEQKDKEFTKLKIWTENQDYRLRVLQQEDFRNFLANNLLIKLDRCLMSHGIEGRTPFVDMEISAYGLNLPYSCKIHQATGKYIVKKWLESILPECQPFRRKQGFTVPIGQWLSEKASLLAPLITSQPGVRPLVKADQILPLFKAGKRQTGLLAWRILFYALWHQIHVLNVQPNGKIDEILDQRP